MRTRVPSCRYASTLGRRGHEQLPPHRLGMATEPISASVFASHSPLACRFFLAPGGPPAPALYCPNLRELELSRCGLADPAGAPFEHLTRLRLAEFDGSSHWGFMLKSAMLRLEALHCVSRCPGALAAAAGHPSLREVWLDIDVTTGPDESQDMLAGLKRLPRLSALKLHIEPYCFHASDDEDEDSDWDEFNVPAPGGSTCMLRTLEHLQRCEHLTSLELDAPFELCAHQALAVVGAALGYLLESLSVGPVLLASSPADAERTLFALPLAFPRLASLTLSLETCSLETMHRPVPGSRCSRCLSRSASCCPAAPRCSCCGCVCLPGASTAARYKSCAGALRRLNAAHQGKRVTFELS